MSSHWLLSIFKYFVDILVCVSSASIWVFVYLSDFSIVCLFRVCVYLINSKGFLLSLKQSVLLGWWTSKIKWLHETKTLQSFNAHLSNTTLCYHLLFLHPSICFVVPLFRLDWGSLVLHCVSCQSLQVHRFSGRKYNTIDSRSYCIHQTFYNKVALV